MRRAPFLLLILALLSLLALLGYRASLPDMPARPNIASSGERTPLCPWREPSRDLLALFSPATNYAVETHILSGSMVPIQKRLGRSMTVDENPLRIFRVRLHEQPAGVVLLCRAKGEHGGIEIVTGVETNGGVRGLLIQSQREPNSVAEVITNASFLEAFTGKTASSPLRVGEDLPDVAAAARASAQAIADAVRSQLIVLSFAEQTTAERDSSFHPAH